MLLLSFRFAAAAAVAALTLSLVFHGCPRCVRGGSVAMLSHGALRWLTFVLPGREICGPISKPQRQERMTDDE